MTTRKPKQPVVWVEGPTPLEKALRLMTNGWIEEGNYCQQTVIDLRNACRSLLAGRAAAADSENGGSHARPRSSAARGSETPLKSEPRVNEGNGGGGLVGLPKLPARLIQVRIERGWTQEELAAKTGQHVTAISHWEAGIRTPNMRNAVKLCNALGCTISWLAVGAVDDIGVAMERKSPNEKLSD